MDQLALLPTDPTQSSNGRRTNALELKASEPITTDDRLARIAQVLGTPYYSRHGVTLYNLDCLEAMRRLPAGLLDLTVTSPPYNIGKSYESRRELDDYVSWCTEWMQEVYRLTSRAGAFWLNLGYVPIHGRGKAIPLPYMLWDRTQFFLLQEIVWNYGAGVASRLSFSPRNEKFLWYVKNPNDYVFNLDDVRDPDVKYPNQKKNGKLKCNPAGKNPTDVWQIAKVTSGADRSSVERTPHPAQFPIELIDRVIKACSNGGQLVLDPFIGSGTTADVAVRLDRQAVGFEVVEDYLKIAINRIEAAASLKGQGSLL
jgi:adenine-specific DNA-methyltransferase